MATVVKSSHSPAWTRVVDQVKIVAESELPILIHSETGTGKEQVVRTIDKLSPRSDKPFIPLNCSALNASLAESELFGHEKSAFPTAVAQGRQRRRAPGQRRADRIPPAGPQPEHGPGRRSADCHAS